MTATQTRVYNFSAGPAVLPEPVLEQIRDEMMCLPGVGSSILEISHRGSAFVKIMNDARDRFRHLFAVPDNYEILFLQGGSILQNTMIPANLITDRAETADCIVTGSWSKKNSQDVKYYGNLNTAWDGGSDGYRRLPGAGDLSLSDGAAYVHYTSNETIQGVQFHAIPDVGDRPLVCDMSSDILCRPVDVSRFGLIYACAQKNSGVAGLTVVIIRRDLLERSVGRLPTYLDYSKHAAEESMANTPPTFAIYVSGLVCKWLQDEIGGLDAMKRLNEQKAALLYDVIDAHSGFYRGHADVPVRSVMNVVFATPDEATDKVFLEQAGQAGMSTLKGHRSVGGIRASIYNAMPLAGVEALSQFMTDFARKHG
jgi:phosphoserine aminotransferase